MKILINGSARGAFGLGSTGFFLLLGKYVFNLTESELIKNS